MNVHAADDPREIVTEHAFRVTPELLGRPLAGPWRRLVALGIDGLVIAILTNAAGLIFGVAALIFVWRISLRPGKPGIMRKSTRLATRLLLAVIAFGVASSLWNLISSDDDDGSDDDAIQMTGVSSISGIQGLAVGAMFLGLREADDFEEAQETLDGMIDQFRDLDVEDGAILEILEDFPVPDDRPWIDSAIDLRTAAIAGAVQGPPRPLVPDSTPELVARYQDALTRNDTAAIEALNPAMTTRFAGDSIAELQEDLDRADQRLLDLAETLDEANDPGILSMLRRFLEDIGLTFGWGSMYFTGAVAFWQGRTPGKRLVGIRIVRLDGLPIGWWLAFERFAGYAAGLATGLLGFAQIFWDRNRQAIQDKIAATVVIRD